jgi:predicted dehydrogenase
MPMDKFRIGIVGAGLIAETAHIPAILKCENADLVVLIESDISRASTLKKKIRPEVPVLRSLGDFKGSLDGVIISTPNDSHRILAVECLERGINVLIEKPLATSYKDAVQIQQEAKEKNLVVMTGFCTRFWPGVKYVRDFIESGFLGKVKRFIFQYGSSSGWAPVSDYTISKKSVGGGAFVINGSHYLDRMLWYFGSPESFIYKDDAYDGMEANGVAEFQYNSNLGQFSGQIRISKTVNLDAGCAIEFEHGIIIHKDWKQPSVTLKFNNTNLPGKLIPEYHMFNLSTRTDMYLLQLEEFINKCRDHSFKGISDLSAAVESVRIIEELYKTREVMRCNWYGNQLKEI